MMFQLFDWSGFHLHTASKHVITHASHFTVAGYAGFICNDLHRSLHIYEWKENFVIRHLIMPNHVECCTKPVLDWIAMNMPEVPINIMDQYYPDNLCDPSSDKYRERYSELARSPTKEEIIKSYKYARDLGLNFEKLSCEKSVFGLSSYL